MAKSPKKAPPAEAPPPEPITVLPEGVKGEFDRDAAKDYVARIESEHAYLKVELTSFEGPLDLLLHLIKKHALDIFDIPIRFITDAFIKILDQMKAADIDIAAEFLVMAATLAHIKSKMLLPPEEGADAEDEEPGDPRMELVRRLLEYQKYKNAAVELMKLGLLFSETWPRGTAGMSAQEVSSQTTVDVSSMDLIAVLEDILRTAKVPITHDVIFERMSVGARINEVIDLCKITSGFTFEAALLHMAAGDPDRSRVVVTLLAVLELARLKLVRIHQTEEGGVIYVTPVQENLVITDVDLLGRDYA